MEATAGFTRFGSTEAARLQRLAEDTVTPADIRTIAEICDQPVVKQWVTGEYATGKGGAYTEADARHFVRKAAEGWRDESCFTYLVRDGAEIGYWADTRADRRGYMTNAVVALCDLAAAAGYRSLYAHVIPGNRASQAVLVRAGFVAKGPAAHPKETKQELLFERTLHRQGAA